VARVVVVVMAFRWMEGEGLRFHKG
jgi:hypothetical protein